MASDETQRRAFKFLSEHFLSQETFTKEEFQKETKWVKVSFQTYISKHFKGFLAPVDGGSYRVSEAFRPYLAWSTFREHVTQVRRVATDYVLKEFENILIYEFFIPLTHENVLRVTLDSLFYKDIILVRLKTVDRAKIQRHFPKNNRESEDRYFQGLCDWIQQKFQGYSISHVSGRFRTEKLSTQDEVAMIQKQGRRYLIDETTAITRFIFPCKNKAEAEKVRFLFQELFIRSIIQLINGEDEIWMVESGMTNRIHIWKATDAEEEADLFE